MKHIAFAWQKLTTGTGKKSTIAFFVRGLGAVAGVALVINPSFLRMQESRELHRPMDSRIRGNDGDGFVTKAAGVIMSAVINPHVTGGTNRVSIQLPLNKLKQRNQGDKFMHALSLQQASLNLSVLVESTINNSEETFIVSDYGTVVMLDEKYWQQIQETLRLLRDKKSLAALLAGHQQREQGITPQGK